MMIEFTNNYTNDKVGVNPDHVVSIEPSDSLVYKDKKIQYDEETGRNMLRTPTTMIEFDNGEENIIHVKELYPEVLHRLNVLNDGETLERIAVALERYVNASL